MKKNIKLDKEKGITLVALIATIIVLIILAAVTIITVTETGLFNTTVAGTENYANAQEYEQRVMDNLDKHAQNVIKNIIEVGSGIENSEKPNIPQNPDEGKIHTTITSTSYEYKYNEKAVVHITYKTDVPINQDTVIKDETIKIYNMNGANASIEKIQSSEKETVVTINVGDKAGEFTVEIKDIKSQNSEVVIAKTSQEFYVGTYMQRITQTIANIGSTGIYAGTLQSIIGNNSNEPVTWGGYSAYIELIFKKSEKMTSISLWTGCNPSSISTITIEGLEENEWKEIGKLTKTIYTEAGTTTLERIEVTEGEYSGIRIKIENKASWAVLGELYIE